MLKTLNTTLGVGVWTAVLLLGLLVAFGVGKLCWMSGLMACHLLHS